MNVIPYILISLIGGFAVYLAVQYYKLWMFNRDTKLKIKFVALLLAIAIFTLPMIPMYRVYQLQGDTVFGISNSGIITQGDVRFDVCWDPTGLNSTRNINWGIMELGIKKTVTVYIINQGTEPLNCVFTLTNPNWVTDDPSKDIDVQFAFSPTTPLQPSRFRRVDISLAILKPLPGYVSQFSFIILITGTKA
jgi:hypothetical protein